MIWPARMPKALRTVPDLAEIRETGNGGLEIVGVIDFYTSPELLKRTRARMKQGGNLEINFAGVERVDSSAAALMLEWLREGHKRNIKLRYTGLPEMLLSLLSVCGLEGRLPIHS